MTKSKRPVMDSDGFITWTDSNGNTWEFHEDGGGCSACRVDGGNPEDDFVFDLPKGLYDAALIVLTS